MQIYILSLKHQNLTYKLTFEWVIGLIIPILRYLPLSLSFPNPAQTFPSVAGNQSTWPSAGWP